MVSGGFLGWMGFFSRISPSNLDNIQPRKNRCAQAHAAPLDSWGPRGGHGVAAACVAALGREIDEIVVFLGWMGVFHPKTLVFTKKIPQPT